MGIAGVLQNQHGLGATYAVSLPIFEGPLDLLLHLIEQEKLDISEVSLVAVTDQYLKSIEHLEELVPGALADFLVVASRLLYIKSTRLLPKPAVGSEEEEDSAENLVRHLLEYRQFKRAAGELREREEEGARLFVRPPTAIDLSDLPDRPPDFGDLDSNLLQKALRRALQRIPVAPPPPKVQPYTVTVADRMVTLRELIATWQQHESAALPALTARPQLAFAALLAQATSRMEIIVTFLAVLELVKQQELFAVQEATFGEIVLVPASERVSDAFSSAEALAPGAHDAAAHDEQRSAKDARTAETEETYGE